MDTERFWAHVRRTFDESGCKKILCVCEKVPEPLTKDFEAVIDKPDEWGGLTIGSVFDAAIVSGGLLGFDPMLLFDQLKRRMRGPVAIAVARNDIGDPRNIKWTSDGLEFGIEALRQMLEHVGFQRVKFYNLSGRLACIAWAHGKATVFRKGAQGPNITRAELKSGLGLGAVEHKKPFQFSAEVELDDKTEGVLRIVAERGGARHVADSPSFSGSKKIEAKGLSWPVAPPCTIKAELWKKCGDKWKWAAATENMQIDVEGFEQEGVKNPTKWAFLRGVAVEHYEKAEGMTYFRPGGRMRLIAGFDGSNPTSVGLLIRLYDKSGFILNQTAISKPRIRRTKGGFELVCDCDFLPLAEGIYRLVVAPISYDPRIATSRQMEKEVWFKTLSEDDSNKKGLLFANMTSEKFQLLDSRKPPRPSIEAVNSPIKKGHWFFTEPNEPFWWEMIFDWPNEGELGMRFQLILPQYWMVLMDKSSKDMGTDERLPSGRWRVFFPLDALHLQDAVLLAKIDLLQDGDMKDSRHFWLAVPKSEAAQEGIVIMPWRGADSSIDSLDSDAVEKTESSDRIDISIEPEVRGLAQLDAISRRERETLESKPFKKAVKFEVHRESVREGTSLLATIKPFAWARDPLAVAGFWGLRQPEGELPLEVEWSIE